MSRIARQLVLRVAFVGSLVLAATSSPFAQSTRAPSGNAQPAGTQPVLLKATAHYDFDSARISAADEARILEGLARMNDVTWQRVEATGHTDATGPDAYNERLAQRRAESVKSLLTAKGVDGSMITTQGRGESAPVASNADANGRAQNRRVEIEFQGVRAAVAQR